MWLTVSRTSASRLGVPFVCALGFLYGRRMCEATQQPARTKFHSAGGRNACDAVTPRSGARWRAADSELLGMRAACRHLARAPSIRGQGGACFLRRASSGEYARRRLYTQQSRPGSLYLSRAALSCTAGSRTITMAAIGRVLVSFDVVRDHADRCRRSQLPQGPLPSVPCSPPPLAAPCSCQLCHVPTCRTGR